MIPKVIENFFNFINFIFILQLKKIFKDHLNKFLAESPVNREKTSEKTTSKLSLLKINFKGFLRIDKNGNCSAR
jgi:hypothetical protein